MYLLYDVVFLVFAVVYIPYLVLTRRYHARLPERLGIFSRQLVERAKGKEFIWLHAVSVGEVIAASSFIKEFSSRFPDCRLLISTVTKTGNKVASKVKRDEDVLIYFPLDLSFIIRRILRVFNVRLFVIMETEIWPNIVTAFSKKNIPIVLINGRLSEKSFRAYRRVKVLIQGVFRRIDQFCMQAAADAARLRALGVDENRIRVTGNMKYDVAAIPLNESEITGLKHSLGINGNTRVLITGSTHRGEDEIIVDAYKQLATTFPDLRLLIAPRHPERAEEIQSIVDRHNLRSMRFSAPAPTFKDADVIILDVIGKLRNLYAIADIVFMGGSLLPRYGGHNLLEPATFKKPILFGPFMNNFKDMAQTFLKAEAALTIKDRDDFKKACTMLLTDGRSANRLGTAAHTIIDQNRGATTRNISYMVDMLNKEVVGR
jgi:3-deoxy-D-manno-octulosonic-acid transferase